MTTLEFFCIVCSVGLIIGLLALLLLAICEMAGR